jgi:hypothetical protein
MLKMSKRHTYIPVKGTGNSLFTRLAADEVNTTAEFAQHIIDFVRDKISEEDMAQLKKLLMGGEAGDEDEPKGVEARGAQDSAARIGEAGFNSRFPSARKIGRDDGYGFR